MYHGMYMRYTIKCKDRMNNTNHSQCSKTRECRLFLSKLPVEGCHSFGLIIHYIFHNVDLTTNLC